MNAVYSPVAYGNPRDNEVSNAQMNSTTRHLLKQNWPYISPIPHRRRTSPIFTSIRSNTNSRTNGQTK